MNSSRASMADQKKLIAGRWWRFAAAGSGTPRTTRTSGTALAILMRFVGGIHFGKERRDLGVNFDHGRVEFILKGLHLIGQIGICVKRSFPVSHEFLALLGSKAAHVPAGARTAIGMRRFIRWVGAASTLGEGRQGKESSEGEERKNYFHV